MERKPSEQINDHDNDARTPEEEDKPSVRYPSHDVAVGDDYDEEEEDGEEEDGPAPPRRWIRNTIVFLFVAGLLGNVIAFWPRIYNLETIPFLNQSRELSVSEQIQSYKLAVVTVGTGSAKGTGFHLSDGYILTNHHVIEDSRGTLVQFPELERVYAAELVGGDADLDLALLKIEPGDETLPHIELERERVWQTGEAVYVIGNPLYFSQIAVEGTVHDLVRIAGREKPVLALDAPVFKGNSGSPVIDRFGKAIGIVYATADIPTADGVLEAGLAVPIGDAAELLAALSLPHAEND